MAPIEPPVGYGLMDRSIFPESQFRKDGGSVFQVARSWNDSLIDTSARCPAARGAGTHSGLHRGKVRMTKAFPVTASIKDSHGHRYRWECAAMAA